MRVILLRRPASQRIDVGQQPVAQVQGAPQSVVHRLARLAEAPDLARRVSAVGAEHGQESAVLEPAHKQLAIAQVVHAGVVVACPEPQLGLVLGENPPMSTVQ